jgi:hypothetical protein
MSGKREALVLVLSIFSFSISLIALYKTQFSSARMRIFAGEHLNVGHFKEGNFQITLPVVLVNSGIKTGVIRRVGLLIQIQASGAGYLLEPYFYQKIDEAGNFQNESQPAPIAIGGKQNLTKQIQFRSSLERATEFRLLDPGSYSLKLLGWTDSSRGPDLLDSLSFTISPKSAAQLQSDFEQLNGKTTRVSQEDWIDWQARTLTEREIKALRT